MNSPSAAPCFADPHPAPEGLEEFLTYRLHLLNKLTDRVTDARYGAGPGITLSDARCIAAVGHFGSLSINALAQRANLDKSQASRAAQRLVQRGLFEKATPAHDQRAIVVGLTPSGRVMHRRVVRIAKSRNDEVFGCLDDEERNQFSHMLSRLLAAARRS